ncbi:hypothetical protein ES705_02370 [subsurface metagenome]|nr:hypothetical protein [Clostridia bacterium]
MKTKLHIVLIMTLSLACLTLLQAVCLGVDYKLSNNVNVAWRIGYNTKTTDVGGLGGCSLGLGGNFKRYRVDYAFVPFGDLGDTHRISISISF